MRFGCAAKALSLSLAQATLTLSIGARELCWLTDAKSQPATAKGHDSHIAATQKGSAFKG